ncbi:hypothetical protein B0H11DRAFT_2214836 [Mycena galericulata]|nr:hypothetical protein B0H11DRAFT_2214836 [Mycena galericulata]
MTNVGPNGASSTLINPGVRSGQWKAAQAAFLANRVSRRSARQSRNTQKVTQNADRATRRRAAGITAGSAADTFGPDEQAEIDSDDDHEVPEPTIVPLNLPPPPTNAQAMLALMGTMNPVSQQMFLTLMINMGGVAGPASSGGNAGAAASATPEKPVAVPRIFSAAAVQPARREETDRPPFSPRILELAAAGIYLPRSIFTNERIQDMFVNQSDPKYQQKKCTILSDGRNVQVYTMDPSIFEDDSTMSHIRLDEAHANYRRWFVENAPVEAAGQLEAYDNHRQRCRDVVLVDERDFVMVQRWCRNWMQRQTWSPKQWDEGIYHSEFEASRARYFEEKMARQMSELEGKDILPLHCRCSMQRQSVRQSAAVKFAAHVQPVSAAGIKT